MKIELSVVIPTYNEQKQIAKTIEIIENYFKDKNISGEIIVSDDASTDQTVSIFKKYQKKYLNLKLLTSSKNYYKGWPVKLGVLAARGEYVLFSDADLATPISEVKKLQAVITKGADIAIGSRIQPGGVDLRATQPFYRRQLGKIFAKLMKLLIPDISDSQCGFKLFRRDVAKKLFGLQKVKNIVFDVEILYLANKFNYKIVQVPVRWNYSGETKMKVNLKNALSVIVSLFKIWLWHH